MCVSHSGVRLNGTSRERKGKVVPIPIAKLRISPTSTNQNRKNFSFHQNSFERYAHTSRPLALKTRLLSRKNRDLLNKTPLLYSPTPHPAALPTHPLFCPSTRAYTHSANFRFLPSPFTTRDISLILGELEVKANLLKAFTRCSEKKSHRENRMSPTSQRVNLRLHVPSPLSSPSTS